MATDDDDFMAELERRKNKCFIDGDFIVFHPHNYEIALGQCDSPEKILAWVAQLAQKQWVTPPLIHQFVVVACGAADVWLETESD
jgi:hypothetical protein